MERLSSAIPPSAKKTENNHKSEPAKNVAKAAPQTDKKLAKSEKTGKSEKKESPPQTQQAAHDFDLALAALRTGDYDAAAALVEKLRRSSQEDPNSYGLAVVQLGLLVQEGKDCALRQKTKSALRAFAKQSRPIQANPSSELDRSV